MHRTTPAISVRPEAPGAIESRALGTLAYIRTSIESSSSMDVPGMAGIVMGIIGVLTAIVVSLPRFAPHWLEIWLVAAMIALVLGGAPDRARRPCALSGASQKISALSLSRTAGGRRADVGLVDHRHHRRHSGH